MALNSTERQIYDEYIRNRFEGAEENSLPGEDSLEIWEKIIDYGLFLGFDKAINAKICPDRPVEFEDPETINIRLYDSFAGRIPVISLGNEKDFEQLVTNVAYGEVRPDNLSDTGASFIHGKTVRFIIISDKPYSNIPAKEIGLSDEEWHEKSALIRLEHECTHFFTKKTYGITNNILHDEIIADFTGIYEAFGIYRAELFLQFMGIIKGSGNRFAFYTNGLSENVKSELMSLSRDVACNLEKWSSTDAFLSMSKAERIKYMCKTGLEGLREASIAVLKYLD